MRQLDLIQSFLEGAREGDARNLHIREDQLVHYSTAILERFGSKYILNYTRYSLATGKVQKLITDLVDAGSLVYVKNVPSETRASLAGFINITDSETDEEPVSFLMEVEHTSFGHGYVIEIGTNMMRCIFGKQEKTLMYPESIDGGMVKVIDDFRDSSRKE